MGILIRGGQVGCALE